MTETETPTALDHDLNRACDMLFRSPENARQTVIRNLLQLHQQAAWRTHTWKNALAEIDRMGEVAAREFEYAKSINAVIPVGPDRVRHEGPVTELLAAKKAALERAEQTRKDAAEAAVEARKMQDQRAEVTKALGEWEAFYRDCWPDDPLPDLAPYLVKAYGEAAFVEPEPEPF